MFTSNELFNDENKFSFYVSVRTERNERKEKMREKMRKGKSMKKCTFCVIMLCESEEGRRKEKSWMIDVPTMISHNLLRYTQCLFFLLHSSTLRSKFMPLRIYQFHFSPFFPPANAILNMSQWNDKFKHVFDSSVCEWNGIVEWIVISDSFIFKMIYIHR